jgi:hypothetical protein
MEAMKLINLSFETMKRLFFMFLFMFMFMSIFNCIHVQTNVQIYVQEHVRIHVWVNVQVRNMFHKKEKKQSQERIHSPAKICSVGLI